MCPECVSPAKADLEALKVGVRGAAVVPVEIP